MDADAIIVMVAERLRAVPGIAAVVLGGSRASSPSMPHSPQNPSHWRMLWICWMRS
jgi:hypothetical protein